MAKNLAIISREFFYFFSAFIVSAIILELLWPNITLAYFNLNYLIIFWLVSGLIYLIKK